MPRVATSETPQIPPKTDLSLEAYTKYEVFDTLNIIPSMVVCDAYKPTHLGPSNFSCHSRVIPTVDNIKNHISLGHSGGFSVEFKRIPQKTAKLWKALKAAGVEIVEMRCDHCNDTVDITVTDVGRHLKPHSGKSRRRGPKATDTFLITFSNTLPTDENFNLDIEDEPEY